MKVSSRYEEHTSSRRRNIILSIVDQLYSILSTVIATVALAYIFPENILSCRLEQQWQSYFRAKNAQAIRTIQDNLQCCGLRSTHDRAWPFKDRNHGDNACELQLGYPRSCLAPWQEQQRVASWMVFAAAVLIWTMRIGFPHISRRRPSWMSAFRTRETPDYQRITQAEEVDEEGNGERTNDAEQGRTLLPHEESGYSNEWGH
ncbi:uncharacterized protein CDV56_105769 [Aspergillus thermomutatus]|uniref:Tetraspanin Tsp3 n=1 Tax=Aspergillus thermomutatus TaxID=41047 RepID=A0A397H837_ASPTH|nr:uncharacterized protein CDV56_105769 [Aspergillus thermomutatus]RHZ59255.1 hypothetical protein CDV56_105769 [Aspergillus thermomutatus]